MKGVPISIWLLLLSIVIEGQAVKPNYKHFDDYLSQLGSEEQKWLIRTDEEIEGSGDVDCSHSLFKTLQIPVPTTKKKSTCCMLGIMAGDKGFHCYVNFYLARIMMRNRNRAHNKKQVFGSSQSMIRSREKLMWTFEQCVAGKGSIFHKCCYLAALKTDRNDGKKHRHLLSKRIKY